MASPTDPIVEADNLADILVGPAAALARSWIYAGRFTRAERARAERVHLLTADPASLSFALAFCDRVLRPESSRVAARQLRHLARGRRPRFLGYADYMLLRAGAAVSRFAPGAVLPLARRRLRSLAGELIADATDPHLRRHLARLRGEGFRVNLNLLGESVLGHTEAAHRRRAVLALMTRPDVDYVSVKVSSVCAQVNLWSYAETLRRTKGALREILTAAATASPPVFVNLDMEEYRDLRLTLNAFTELLDEPELVGLEAGIVLQAYLPDSLDALRQLAAWAMARRKRRGAAVKVRIVKGANLAAERVDAAMHGWPLAPYGTKEETDANHKAMVEYALRKEHGHALKVGIAGHNLFDLAWAHLLADARGVGASVDFEMLNGMAPASARTLLALTRRVVLYTPVVAPADFDHAVAYLFRRLEENAGGENFLAALPDLDGGGPTSDLAFERERSRFTAAVAGRHAVRTARSRAAGGAAPRPRTFGPRPTAPRSPDVEEPGRFRNEPDTDPTDIGARARLVAALHSSGDRLELPGEIDDSGVDAIVAAAARSRHDWAGVSPAERATLLERCAETLAARRTGLVALLAAEGRKTLAEADTEVSEAVDFARWYANAARELDRLDGAVATPLGIVVVAGPWNFPLAIPAGGAFAALAAGNAVILKPAPQTPAVAFAAVSACWEAGVPRDVLQLARCPDGPVGSRLIAHPAVSGIVLTGSFETAELFARLAEVTPLLAETSGKNAMVVMPEADLDQAAADVAHSAFSHAGQKCSAASLVIMVGDVAHSDRFRSQLVDAVNSLQLGPATDPGTAMGPLLEPPSDKLRHALTSLEGGQRWLLRPREVDPTAGLWSPGIVDGVEPGDWFVRTECFGPVLGLIAAEDLDEALAIQNAIPYGLTGGIWSLDPTDCAHWVERVEVGNAYVNRPTTGAIVGRQPFGGCKRSVVGPAAKTGGPNYVLQLCRVDDGLGPPALVAEPTPAVRSLLGALGTGLSSADQRALQVAAGSDAYWWAHRFGTGHDEAELFCESNTLHYRPLPGLTIRVVPGTRPVAVARVCLAALAAGCDATVSVRPGLPGAHVPEALYEHTSFEVVTERAAALVARVDASRWARIRLVGTEPELGALEPAVHVDRRPPVLCGRVELLRYLREQTVSRTLHRFGSVVPSPDG